MVERFGREVEIAGGDGCVMSEGDAGATTFQSSCSQIGLRLPRDALGLLLRDKDIRHPQPIPSMMRPALRLLTGYVELLKDEAATPSVEVQRLAVTHVYDLLALALGATRDATELAKGRGVRAARLCAIKKEVIANLTGELSINAIAARQKLTSRYVQMLFEDEGMTFTEFVREQRLERAHGMLTSRRFDHRRITDIAFEVGFGDLSYFNRLFVRRFGLSPRDLRQRSALA